MGNSFLNLGAILESEQAFQSMKNVFAKSVNDAFLSTAIQEITSLNEELKALDIKAFKLIKEAETKSEENNQFCAYYKEYRAVIQKFTDKIKELASRCCIKIDNIVDANIDIIEDDNYDIDFTPFDMDVCEFKDLLNNDLPKFNVKKHYMKEFNNIGQLMQDLGNVASDDVKLKIIASTYNSLKKYMDDDFLEKCAEKMFKDDDCYDKKKSMAEQILNMFKGESSNKTISKTDVQEARSVLMNISAYEDAINNLANKLVCDFTCIADEVGDMIFRNKSCTLRINTDQDGIRNRDYELSTYSMNQFNIFMKQKTLQISQICNMYMIAFSIKLDCIADYIIQNKDIVFTSYSNNVAINTSDDTTDEEPEDGGSIDIDDDGNFTDTDDSVSDDSDDSFLPDDDFGLDDDDDIGDSGIEDSSEPEEVGEDGDISNESYIFEYELFNLERVAEQEAIKEQMADILNEDMDNLNKMANNNSNKLVDIWRTVVEKLSNIFNKFIDRFVHGTTPRINQLTQNKTKIEKNNFADNATIKYYNVANLDKLTVPDLTYDEQQKNLLAEGKNAFYNSIAAKIGGIKEVGEGKAGSIKESITEFVRGTEPDKEYTIGQGNVPNKADMYTYCTATYKRLVDEIRKEKAIIDKAQNNAKRIAENITTPKPEENKPDAAKPGENKPDNNAKPGTEAPKADSSEAKGGVKEAAEYYFNEFDQGAVTKSAKNHISVYFSVVSIILSNKMSLALSAFNEYYKALNSLTGEKPVQDANKK